jgi:hypothetical protein
MTTLSTARLYKHYLHPLMAGGSSGILTATLLLLLRNAAGLAIHPLVAISLPLMTGVIEALAGNIAYDLRTPVSARFRELLLILLLTYAVAALTVEGSIWERLRPGFLHGTLLIVVALHWMSAARMHGYLRQREDYLFSVARKRPGEIRSVIRDTRGYTVTVYRSLQRVRGQMVTNFVLLTVGFIVLWGLGEPAAPLTTVFFVLSAFAAAAVVFATNLFLEEYASSADGLAVPRRFQRRRLVASGIVLGTGFVVAVAVSSNTSLLDMRLFGALAEWISGWFSGPQETARDTREFDFMRYFPSGPGRFNMPREGTEVSEFWRGFAVVFRWTVIGVFALAVTTFMAAPFFSRQFHRDLRRAGIRTRIRNALIRLVTGLWRSGRLIRLRLRLLLRRRPAGTDDPAQAPRGTDGRAAPRRPAPLRVRRQRSTLRSLYTQLVTWANSHGVAHHDDETVREFAGRLVAHYPQTCEAAPEAGEILTHALYAPEPLSRHELTRFKTVAKEIVKTEEPA